MAFNPEPKKPTKHRNINIQVSPGYYDVLVQLSAEKNISLKEFCRQAITYAVSDMEGSK